MRQRQSSTKTGLAVLVSTVLAAGAFIWGASEVLSSVGRAYDRRPTFHHVKDPETGMWHCRWAKDNDGDGNTDIYVEWKDKNLNIHPRWSGEMLGYPPGQGELEYPRPEQVITCKVEGQSTL